jgi:hypothetical protein
MPHPVGIVLRFSGEAGGGVSAGHRKSRYDSRRCGGKTRGDKSGNWDTERSLGRPSYHSVREGSRGQQSQARTGGCYCVALRF